MFQDLNDGLINLSITSFGLSGPYARWSSTPLVSLALGGYLYLTGDESREPLMLPGYQSQHLAGLQGYAGIMLALRARDGTGKGQPVEISEIESLASLHQFTTVLHTYHGAVRRRAGLRFASGRIPGIAGGYPNTTLPCKDGYVSFTAAAPHQWVYLCRMIGREDLLEDPRFADFSSLWEVADEIDTIMVDWMKDKRRDDVVELAAGKWSVPASPVLDLGEVLKDAQYNQRGLFKEIDHPHGGTLTFPTAPFLMSKTPSRFTRAPTLGEHNGRDHLRSADKKPRRPKNRESRGGPLDGVRVLDLTRVWAGPLTTRVLSDFGAEVIKISDPRVPIDRTLGTNNKLNRNKPNVALRLDTPEGRSTFLDLTAVSDIVIESFRPRVMGKFDLGYDALRAVRPDLIMCALSGYGSKGEHAEYPAYGSSVESITGIPSLTGYKGEHPMTSGIAYPDPSTAVNALAALLTALRHRERTGEGQYIDLALSEGPVCQIGEFVASARHTGGQANRHGNSHYRWAPHGVYPAGGDDRWIAIAVTNDEQWRGLCEAMGRPELATDGRFRTEPARKANEQVLDRTIAEWTKHNDSNELTHRLQSMGIPAGAVHDNKDLLEDPHLQERGFFVELTEPDVGSRLYPGQAILTAGVDHRRWKPSARLGEHTYDILSGLLSVAKSTISDMEGQGAIGTYKET